MRGCQIAWFVGCCCWLLISPAAVAQIPPGPHFFVSDFLGANVQVYDDNLKRMVAARPQPL